MQALCCIAERRQYPRITRAHMNLSAESVADNWCVIGLLSVASCDTTSAMGRFMLTVMSGIAELERDLIRKRCAAGIARAKANGKQFGRPKALDPSQHRKIAEQLFEWRNHFLVGAGI
jgi:putative DNA-invertase from lambdoid prophage Rac